MTDEPHDDLPPELLAALRMPVVADPAVIDSHIDSALALFDLMGGVGDDPGGDARVTPLRSRRQPARWVAAAAAIIVVAGGVWLAARGGSAPVQSADRVAQSALSTTSGPALGSAKSAVPAQSPASAAKGSAASAPTDPSGSSDATASAPSTTPFALPQTLGEDATAGQSATTTTAPTPSCPAPRLRSALISIGTTTVRGRTRLVYTYVSGPEGRIITRVLLDPTTCARS